MLPRRRHARPAPPRAPRKSGGPRPASPLHATALLLLLLLLLQRPVEHKGRLRRPRRELSGAPPELKAGRRLRRQRERRVLAAVVVRQAWAILLLLLRRRQRERRVVAAVVVRHEAWAALLRRDAGGEGAGRLRLGEGADSRLVRGERLRRQRRVCARLRTPPRELVSSLVSKPVSFLVI